jgi:serine/threonine protein kinase
MTLQPGTRLGAYEITTLLGSGGMGQVYKAKDLKLARDVAIKVLREELASDPQRLRRFEQEARSASALNHPNIITIHDIRLRHTSSGLPAEALSKERGQVGEETDIDFIVMEYVEGQTLREMLAEGQLATKNLLQLTTQIAEGLAKAHSAGIVHRDLKPENLMVTNDGYVKILDFGLAKLLPQPGADSEVATITKEGTVAGAVMGTACYMSPEQALGKPLDARTDVFSLGAVLYEMATGMRPFKGDTPAGLFNEILNKTPSLPSSLNPELPTELDGIIHKDLCKNPGERYPSAGDMLQELKTVTEKPRVSSKRSIAVLPFDNMSADTEQEYFCDGMAEEIINALTRVENLRVIARTSAFAFKGKHEDVGEIGRRLGVDTLLEGSVRKAGKRLRITAQLIHVEDGSHLWSERYDRELEDVFAIQDEISLNIVDRLKVELVGGERAAISRRAAVDPEVYNLYLLGSYHWNRATQEDMKKSQQYFLEAIARDTNLHPPMEA